MPQHEVKIRETIPAPREQVFEFFADHQKFTTLFGGGCQRIKDGEQEPNGLGSIRRIGPGPFGFEETIVAFERASRIDYQVTRGSPIKNHLGSIRFSDAGSGTQIDYVIRFDAKIPGTGGFIAWLLGWGWRRNAPAKLARIA